MRRCSADGADLPQDTIDAVGLAFDDAGYEAGGVEVELGVLTGSDPRADAATTAALNARTAARDSTAIAYIGETLPEATAASVPITNAAGIPQVSPSVVTGELLREREGGADVPTEVQTSGERTLFAIYEEGPLPVISVADGEEFSTRFEHEFGRPPGPASPGAFEAASLVLDAIDRAEDPLDRASVAAALLATDEKPSLFGTYSIGPDGAADYGSE